MLCEYKLLRRKPSKWAVSDGTRTGTVEKTGSTERRKRWRLHAEKGGFFPSRRAAMHFFTTGERFKTRPRFAVVNGRRSTKRSR